MIDCLQRSIEAAEPDSSRCDCVELRERRGVFIHALGSEINACGESQFQFILYQTALEQRSVAADIGIGNHAAKHLLLIAMTHNHARNQQLAARIVLKHYRRRSPWLVLLNSSKYRKAKCS